MSQPLIELQARAVRFYSEGDEAAFFEWLDKISSITGYTGSGPDLLISVDRQRVDEEALREMLALFCRYKIDMSQLSLFDVEQFSEWFRAPNSYWYQAVFGEPGRTD